VAVGLETVFPDYEALRARDFAGLCCPKPTVMLAMTPRTGSTHLCAALHAAGLPFEPTEILNPRGPAGELAARRGAHSFAAYIESLAATPGPLFMFKTGWLDFAPHASAARRLFPDLRVVYLNRRNVAAQAVSDFRAKTFNLWHRRPGQPRPDAATLAQGFDPDEIMRLLRALEAEKQAWETWFTANGVAPLRLAYEEFEPDVNIALRILAAVLQLPLQRVPPGTGLEKLADATSADWTERVMKRLFNMS
jgi:LPS sulfotransferase NodH